MERLIESSFIELSDHRFMQAALSLAREQLGQTWPNPTVGTVIVRDGRIIAHGRTARGGRPHAETQALAQAGVEARGTTLYVTLEPCAHHGHTPPCADAIIAAGVARVVIACRDLHPLVVGKGIALLQQAGIEVIEGVEAAEATEINRGFFSVIEQQRPYIALKIASSLDGKIAFPPSLPPLAGGGIRWITGETARAYGHRLRSRYDAVATGIGTVLADDPLLTCRLPGLEDRSPVRVVFDRQGRLPPDSQLAKTADRVPLWVMTSDVREAAAELARRGVTRLLVEAGARLSTAFLHSGLVDRLYWFRAPIVIGEGGLAAVHALPYNLCHWRREDLIVLGNDHLEIYERSESPPKLNAVGRG